MPFTFEKMGLPGVILCKPRIFADDRGYFFESWNQRDFMEGGILEMFVQDNQSASVKDTLRGLHYQSKPFMQAKLVRVLSGTVLDCAVDIRPGSPTFKKHLLYELTAEKGESLFIPEGFAHGFRVLSDRAVVLYKASAFYSPDHDRGIAWDDPDLDIDWGIQNPILSEKDKRQPRLKDIDYAEL
jgi:dTDP-4-dehydrorhamnose 3,5-epimerase